MMDLMKVYLSDLSFLSAGLSHRDLPQEAVVCVDDWNVKTGEIFNFDYKKNSTLTDYPAPDRC